MNIPKSRILLLNPPADKLYLRDWYDSTISKAGYYWPPFNLVVQSGILNSGYDVHVLDANVERLSLKRTLRRIEKISPHYVLFLIGIASFEGDLSFARLMKERFDMVLIGNGDLFTFNPEDILTRHTYVDAALMDFMSPAILDYNRAVKSHERIPNLAYHDGKEVISGSWEPGIGRFSIPIPRHDLFPLERYSLPFGEASPLASTLTSYGCPYPCKFCNKAEMGLRLRYIDNLMEELDYIDNGLKIKKVFFTDLTFTADSDHATNVCRAILENNLRISWNCYSRVDTVDRELLGLMKDAGCYMIQFGVECANEEVLKKYDKTSEVTKIKEAFELCRDLGLGAGAHFILGLPGEDEESLMATLGLAKDIRPAYASFNIASPRPGSKLREEFIREGLIAHDRPETKDVYNYPTLGFNVINRKELQEMSRKIIFKFYLRLSYVWGKISEVSSLGELKRLFKNGYHILKTLNRW